MHPWGGIVTAVGPQHLESFKTIENVQRTKFELVDALPADGLAVINNDFEKIADRPVDNVRCIRYAVANPEGADYVARDIEYTPTGTRFTVVRVADSHALRLSTRLVGECNISNLTAAVAMAQALGVSDERIAYAVEEIEQVEHRLSIKRIPGGLTIIDDAYNSNPVGSAMALDVLSAMTARRSVREYSGEPVPQELLDRIIRAGLLSASGRRRRPWELIVVRDRDTLAKLAGCRDAGSAMLAGADAAIAVLGNPEVADTWVEDCSIVMANMHLEASASGVGSCWIQGRMRTAADGRSTQDSVADLLGIPKPWQLEAILSLGMPKEQPDHREFDNALMEKVHEERF